MMRGTAQEFIPWGAPVLCRAGRVSLAPLEIANGTAIKPKLSLRHYGYEKGDLAFIEPVDGLGQRDLHAMANAPLMEPSRIYLPAGKCSLEELNRREDWRTE